MWYWDHPGLQLHEMTPDFTDDFLPSESAVALISEIICRGENETFSYKNGSRT